MSYAKKCIFILQYHFFNLYLDVDIVVLKTNDSQESMKLKVESYLAPAITDFQTKNVIFRECRNHKENYETIELDYFMFFRILLL